MQQRERRDDPKIAKFEAKYFSKSISGVRGNVAIPPRPNFFVVFVCCVCNKAGTFRHADLNTWKREHRGIEKGQNNGRGSQFDKFEKF